MSYVLTIKVIRLKFLEKLIMCYLNFTCLVSYGNRPSWTCDTF